MVMGKKRSRRQPEKVESIYAKGKKRHVLVNGMISWGLAVGIIFLTLQNWWQNGFSYLTWKDTAFSLKGAGTIGLFMAAGLIWGNITWSIVEKQVKNVSQNRNKQSRKQKQAVKSL
jgi:hypothetical protein